MEPAITFPQDAEVVDGTVYAFGPDGIQFARPVELKIRYDPTQLAPGVQESSLRLHKVVGGTWQLVTESDVNANDKTVSGFINSFGLIGIRARSSEVPSLIVLSPSSELAGQRDFTLRVKGTGFIESSIVRWNGVDVSTQFTDDTHLQAVVPAANIASAGTPEITVWNPPPGGGESDPLTFCIAEPPTGSKFVMPVDCGIVSFGYGGATYHAGLDIIPRTSDQEWPLGLYSYTTSVRAAEAGIVKKIYGLGENSISISRNLRRWDPDTDDTDGYSWEDAETYNESNPAPGGNVRSNHGLGISVIIYHPDLKLYSLYGHLDAVRTGLQACLEENESDCPEQSRVDKGEVIGRMGISMKRLMI